MISLPRRQLAVVTGMALASSLELLAAPAAAHIELDLPMNRYSNIRAGENKACPCGSGTTSRRCDNPDEFSDDDRSLDRVTTYAPGSTITVRFDEYVGHDGRYRIAFDPNGADLPDFNQHILLDEPDPRGNTGNVGEDSIWEFQITLPDMTCDNCTLQLIQVMDGNTVDPVLDPSTRGSTYFQCADIVLAEGTPPGGIPPREPSEHLAERRRAERAPPTPTEPEPAEMTGNAPATAMTGGAGNASATPVVGMGNGSSAMSSAGGGAGACTLVPGRSARAGLSGLTLLAAAAVVALRSRRRSR